MTFEIGVLHRKRPHLLSDLSELILFVKYDSVTEISRSSLQRITNEMAIAPEELDEDAASVANANGAEQRETIARHIEDCWSQLEYRASKFGEFYPFSVVQDRLIWKTGNRTSK